jgi:hypothetical protein
LDDEALFRNYLKLDEKYAEEDLQKQDEFEKKIGGIPEDLKAAIRNPDSYSFVSMVYNHYVTVQSIKKLEKQEAEAAAKEVARRNAIVPVERNSKEYRDALDSYKKAIENENQSIAQAQQDAPSWARAKYLIETKGIGSVPSIYAQEEKFTKDFDNAKNEKYNQWKKGFEIATSISAIDQEWKKEPASRPVILFIVNIMSARMSDNKEKKPYNSSNVDRKELLKGDWNTVEQYKSLLKQSGIVFSPQLEQLEKELHIPAKLKEELKTNNINSTLFLFYETYFREFTPDHVNKAKQEVSAAITKLNNLRPNWAIEEKIEFPDKFSLKMHELGLDVAKPYWTWLRILLLSSLPLVILFVIILKIRGRFKKEEKQEE